MKIVYLDSFTVNPKEIDLEIFKDFGDFKMYDRTTATQVVERAQDADILLVNKVKITADVLEKLPKLKYIGVTATGYNIVDVHAAAAKGITVTNARNYSSMSVAQQTFAMILAFSNRLAEHDNPKKWASQPDFCYYDYTITELEGKVLGLLGFGDIGKAVARIGMAFGMQIIVHKKTPFAEPIAGITEVSQDELFSKSDYLSLHCPLTPENEGLVNINQISKMKSSAVLINTARGGLINENDLSDALNAKRIAGAYLDVLTEEPPKPSNPLLISKNCKVSPHIAWASLEARQKLIQIVYDNIKAFLAGSPQNVVK
ncbi:D-2-hydroxyacid dehydrogenase [Lacihabitans lacunae]|uniref:D-2-hydroxyacid dehydrogenase n=1 Tax=Lacihabitans lacunae TaxID=1028214 RepID=A0ABV7YZ46_9BACT